MDQILDNNLQTPYIRETNSLNRLLKTCKVDQDDKDKNNYFNFVIPEKGSYMIGSNTLEKFWKIYHQNNEPINILEKRQDASQVVIDIDIKKTNDEYQSQLWLNNKFYTIDMVKALINAYQIKIKELYKNISDIQLDAILLEKDIYKKNENTWSGGLHIQFPNLFIYTETHKNVLIPAVKDILKEIDGLPKEFIELDVNAACINSWCLYGSAKSIQQQPYKITKIFNSSLNEMTVNERLLEYKIFNTDDEKIKLTKDNLNENIPRILSITPRNRPIVELKKNSYVNPPTTHREKKDKKTYQDQTIDQLRIDVKNLLSCLKSKTCDDYNSWQNVGFILNNISNGDEEFLDIWNEWSKQSNNYQDGACDNKWFSMKVKKDGLGIGTLKMMAKEDNEILYKTFFKDNSWMYEIILNPCDKNCADIFAKHSQGEIFYTDSHKWTIYNKKTRFWSFNNNKDALIYPICDFFCKNINEFIADYILKHDNTNSKEQEFLKIAVKYTKVFGMSHFASGVISQLQDLVTKTPDIFKTFEQKPELFAFSDGYVIDLTNNGQARKIIKEDKLFKHCGYPLPERNKENMEKAKNFLLSCVEYDDDYQSLISLLSCNLYGENINEKCFLLTGTGGNGKGVIIEIQKNVLGNYFTTIDMGQFTTYEKDANRANSSIAACQYSRCIMASEPKEDAKFISNTFKKHTGRDSIRARFLGKDDFEFVPKYTPILMTNICLPFSGDVDAAIKRRVVNYTLPFEFVVDNGQELKEYQKYADINFKTELRRNTQYRDGLLWILVDVWIKNKGTFISSKRVLKDTESYLAEQNQVLQWFLQNYEKDDDGRKLANDLRQEYINQTGDGVSVTKFGKLMNDCCDKIKSRDIKYKCKRIRIIENDINDGTPQM